MNRKGDSFDKEFRLENKTKKTGSSRRKLPSWLLILAGVAVIGGVVAAHQPAAYHSDPDKQQYSGNQYGPETPGNRH